MTHSRHCADGRRDIGWPRNKVCCAPRVHCTMKIFEAIYKCVFVASVLFVGGYVPYMYWRIHQIYKRAGGQVERIGFLWFAVYVQGTQSVSGVKMLEELPQDIKAQVAAFRLRNRQIHLGVALWIIGLILFGPLVKRIFA